MSEFAFGDQYSLFLRNYIPGAKAASGNKEIICRCKYCPDSRDPNHGHMYIHVPQNPKDISTFYCQKCHTSGIVDSQRLKEWGIYDPATANGLDEVIKSGAHEARMRGLTRELYAYYPYVDNELLASIKVDYINRRLGLNFTINDLLQNYIIPNLKEGLIHNGYTAYTRDERIVDQLNQYFVGFLSVDGNFVNLRRIPEEGVVNPVIDKRYINYNIHNKFDNTEKMYVIPTKIDLTQPQRVQIHIAEGPMDILSIKYNLRRSPGIYAAVTGSGYKGFIMHLLTTFKIFYFDLHIYPDNDQHGTDEVIMDLAQMVNPLGANVFVHRNTFPGEKDFGVPLNKIDEIVYTVDSMNYY